MIQRGHDIGMDALAEQITQAILSETFLNKQSIKPTVKAILKSYLKKADAPKHFCKKVADNEREKYTMAIHKEKIEHRYWKDEIRKIISPSEMEAHFIKLDNELKDLGL